MILRWLKMSPMMEQVRIITKRRQMVLIAVMAIGYLLTEIKFLKSLRFLISSPTSSVGIKDFASIFCPFSDLFDFNNASLILFELLFIFRLLFIFYLFDIANSFNGIPL